MVKCFNLLLLGTFNNTDKTISTSSAITIVLIGFFVFETDTVVFRGIFYLHSFVILEDLVVPRNMKFFIAIITEKSFVINAILRCGEIIARLANLQIRIRVTQLNRNFAVDLVAELYVVLAVNGVFMLVNPLFCRAVTFQVN